MNDHEEPSVWLRCPICGRKTHTKVCKDTVLVNFPLYCRYCARQIRIDVVQLKMVHSKEITESKGAYDLNA